LENRECHVLLPPDRWHAGFVHEECPDDEDDIYPEYDRNRAAHNVKEFPRFVEALMQIVHEKCVVKREGRDDGKGVERRKMDVAQVELED
jgi:hypothetical protein